MLLAPILALALQAQPAVVSGTASEPPVAQQQEVQHQQEPARRQDDDQPEPNKPPTPARTGVKALFGNLAGDYTHLAHLDNVIVAALGGAGALAAHPLDRNFNVHLRSHYSTVNTAFAPAKYLGNTPEQLGLSLGTFAIGRMVGSDKASHLGMDLLRAQILTESMVEPIKLAVGRERPDASNHLSFPSGHSAITFAAATVIERHLGWKQSVLGYTIASYVAASRMHDNVHYLSDVIFGATIGTIAGRTVTQHGRHYWTFMPVKVPGGVAVVAVRVQPSAASAR